MLYKLITIISFCAYCCCVSAQSFEFIHCDVSKNECCTIAPPPNTVERGAIAPTDTTVYWLDDNTISSTGNIIERKKYYNGNWITEDYYNLLGKTFSDQPAYQIRCDGQSNMGGSNETPLIETADNLASDPRVLAWDDLSGEWEIAALFESPFDAPASGIISNNICFQIAKERARIENRPVELILNAWGGQGISAWNPRTTNTGFLWTSGVNQQNNSGMTEVDDFYFYQGEADRTLQPDGYKGHLYRIIDSLKTTGLLKQGGRFIQFEIAGVADRQNVVIESLAQDSLDCTYYISTKGLVDIWDAGNHVDSKGITKLGKIAANEIFGETTTQRLEPTDPLAFGNIVIFFDESDNQLKFKDHTGTIMTFSLVP